MKELTEYKELTPEDAKKMHFPIPNCVFKDKDSDEWIIPDDGSFHYCNGLTYSEKRKKFLFSNGANGMLWPCCAEVITRSPRYVPGDFPQFPPELPFLAFLGFRHPDDAIGPAYTVTSENEWKPASDFAFDDFEEIPVAIDVSTDWAREKHPEIVEAMEYEPIYGNEAGRGVIGHKLGEEIYDEYWNPLPTRLTPTAEDYPGVEPPDYNDWQKSYKYIHREEDERKCFNAGKARGKWEALQEIREKFADINWLRANVLRNGPKCYDLYTNDQVLAKARLIKEMEGGE